MHPTSYHGQCCFDVGAPSKMVNQNQNDIVSMVGDLLGYNLSWPVHIQKHEMLTQCWFNVVQQKANVKSKMGNRLLIVYMTFLRPQQFTF